MNRQKTAVAQLRREIETVISLAREGSCPTGRGKRKGFITLKKEKERCTSGLGKKESPRKCTRRRPRCTLTSRSDIHFWEVQKNLKKGRVFVLKEGKRSEKSLRRVYPLEIRKRGRQLHQMKRAPCCWDRPNSESRNIGSRGGRETYAGRSSSGPK